MIQRQETAREFLVSNQQLAEPVEPTVAHLHDPAARLALGVALFGLGFCAAVNNVCDVAMPFNDAQQLGTSVTRVCTQMLAAPLCGHGPLDDDVFQDLLQLFAVIDVRPGHDDRQRDATPVYQQMTLAPIFFPDPSGWGRQLLAPAAL